MAVGCYAVSKPWGEPNYLSGAMDCVQALRQVFGLVVCGFSGVCVCVCMCVGACVFLCACVIVYAHAHTQACEVVMGFCVWDCVSGWGGVCVCVCVCVCLFVCMCVDRVGAVGEYVCVYVCVRAHVYAYIVHAELGPAKYEWLRGRTCSKPKLIQQFCTQQLSFTTFLTRHYDVTGCVLQTSVYTSQTRLDLGQKITFQLQD